MSVYEFVKSVQFCIQNIVFLKHLAEISLGDNNVATVTTPEANKLYSIYLLKDGAIWYHEEAKSSADKQISSATENIFFKARMIPKDASKNALSDYSEASVKLPVAGIFNIGSNSGGSSASGSSDSTGSSDSSSDSSSSSTGSASSATTVNVKPAEGVSVDKAAAGEKVNEASVAVSLVDANGNLFIAWA